jgi:uncharacterized protein DUF5985
MSYESWIALLSGAVTLGYVVAGAMFLKSWQRTRDRLFISFALAFWLFALNQLLSATVSHNDRQIRYEYLLRVLGFVLILVGIAGKNMSPTTRGRRD